MAYVEIELTLNEAPRREYVVQTTPIEEHEVCTIVQQEDRHSGAQWWEARLVAPGDGAVLAMSPLHVPWPWREGWRAFLTLFKPVGYCVDRCIEDAERLRQHNRALVAHLKASGWRPVVSDAKGNITQMRRTRA